MGGIKERDIEILGKMHSRATIEREEEVLKRQRRLEIVKCLLYFESLHATEIILNWDEGRAKNINDKINQFCLK